MRIFGSDRVQKLMERLGVPDDQPIEHGVVSKSIESAQKKVEGYNFDVRKRVVEFDDVMNKQRETIYRRRRKIQENNDIKAQVAQMIEEEVDDLVGVHTADDDERSWNVKEIYETIHALFPIDEQTRLAINDIQKVAGDAQQDREARAALRWYLRDLAQKAYEKREQEITAPVMRQVERAITLQAIDSLWVGHLDTMDRLRQSVSLRGYGQKDPLVEYKRDGYDLFTNLLRDIRKTTVFGMYHVQVTQQAGVQATPAQSTTIAAALSGQDTKIGRNDPCWCGSGLKFKKCGLINLPEHQKQTTAQSSTGA